LDTFVAAVAAAADTAEVYAVPLPLSRVTEDTMELDCRLQQLLQQKKQCVKFSEAEFTNKSHRPEIK
jgi:hypothetical protein